MCCKHLQKGEKYKLKNYRLVSPGSTGVKTMKNILSESTIGHIQMMMMGKNISMDYLGLNHV